MIDKLLF